MKRKWVSFQSDVSDGAALAGWRSAHGAVRKTQNGRRSDLIDATMADTWDTLFSPVVAVVTSPDANEVFRVDGLASFLEYLAPFRAVRGPSESNICPNFLMHFEVIVDTYGGL